MTTLTIQQLVQHYNMHPHPEGGYYVETYRSDEIIPHSVLPDRYAGETAYSTAIYYLLPEGVFSTFHKISSDECWHFYAGGPLHVYVIHKNGELQIVKLGPDIANGQTFQYVVPGNCWFTAEPAKGAGFSFVGCTVAPGFNFTDFELADAAALIKEYPKHINIIKRLCRF